MDEQMNTERKFITDMHMNSVMHIPEFKKALMSWHTALDDESICEIVMEAAKKMDIRNPKYRDALKSARRIFMDTFGSYPDCLNLKIWIPAGYRDLSYLIDLFKPVNTYLIAYAMQDRMFLRSVRKYGHIGTQSELCLVFELVFCRSARMGEKNSADKDKRYRYSVFRKITSRLDMLVFGDVYHWHKTYTERYSGS